MKMKTMENGVFGVTKLISKSKEGTSCDEY